MVQLQSENQVAEKLSWEFVLASTTTAILRAGAHQEIAGLLCQINEGPKRNAIMIKGAHGLLGYAPTEIAEQIAIEMQEAGAGRLEGKILRIECKQVTVHLRYLCRAQ